MHSSYDEDERKKVEAENRIRAEDLRNDTRAILQIPAGRRFIRRLIHECHFFEPQFPASAEIMAFNEGQRLIGLAIINIVTDAKPDALGDILLTTDEV